MYADRHGAGSRRFGAGLATLAIHGVLAAGLLWGLSIDVTPPGDSEPPLTTVDLTPPPPPPPPPEPQQAQAAPKPAGDEGKKGEALPREAPIAAIPLSETPAATRAEVGRDASAGAGNQGTGAGAGGQGAGSGGGGDGGIASRAQRISGALRDSDYPRGAEEQGLAGTVAISFRVRTDGRVDRCSVVRSSGSPILDDLTCRLYTERFRFRPATTASGTPVESTLQTSFTWGTRRRR
ncbi:energy transducer TonB [Tsuneonella sp. HG249]